MAYQAQSAEFLGTELEALQGSKKAREAGAAELGLIHEKVQRCVRSIVQSPDYLGRWRKLEGALAELHTLGDEMLRLEALAGLELPEGLLLIGQALTKLAVPIKQRKTESPNPTAEDNAEVEQVRALLPGRVMLIVGSECRPDAVRRLKTTFVCSVRWQETAPHVGSDVFEPAITDEVAMVLLLIRWSSHRYQELAQTCEARGVPLVRVSGGYNPNRVAHDVWEQANMRLDAPTQGG